MADLTNGAGVCPLECFVKIGDHGNAIDLSVRDANGVQAYHKQIPFSILRNKQALETAIENERHVVRALVLPRPPRGGPGEHFERPKRIQAVDPRCNRRYSADSGAHGEELNESQAARQLTSVREWTF